MSDRYAVAAVAPNLKHGSQRIFSDELRGRGELIVFKLLVTPPTNSGSSPISASLNTPTRDELTSRRCARANWSSMPKALRRSAAGLGLSAKLTRQRLKRGVFRSIVELQAAINRFLREANEQPKPFTWTADPDKIIAAVRRGHQALASRVSAGH